MTWTPQAQVLDLTPIAENLLAYIEANDEDALIWAGTDGEFAKTYANSGGRLQTKFPSLMVLTQECDLDLSGELLTGDYQLVLEGTVSGPNTDELVVKTKAYAKATGSMVMSIPSATLTAGTGPAIDSMKVVEFASVLDLVRGVVGVTGFVQVFQIRTKFKFVAAAY